MAAFPVVEITDCVHSQDDSFQRVPSVIVLNAISVITVCQCGHKLHKTVSLTWINVLSCIPHTPPAAVEQSYYISSWHGKLATVSRHIFLSLSLLSPEIKYAWLARYYKLDLKEEKGWTKVASHHFIKAVAIATG